MSHLEWSSVSWIGAQTQNGPEGKSTEIAPGEILRKILGIKNDSFNFLGKIIPGRRARAWALKQPGYRESGKSVVPPLWFSKDLVIKLFTSPNIHGVSTNTVFLKHLPFSYGSQFWGQNWPNRFDYVVNLVIWPYFCYFPCLWLSRSHWLQCHFTPVKGYLLCLKALFAEISPPLLKQTH